LIINLSGGTCLFSISLAQVGTESASRKKHFPDSTTLRGTSAQSLLPYLDSHQAVVKCASSSGELPGGDDNAQLAEIKNDRKPTTKALIILDFTFIFI
jgi:hypothetical protein